MPSLREIRRRIKTAKNIQQITKAMKMVAAARLRRAQARMLAARPFAETIDRVIGEIAQTSGVPSHPLLEVRPGAFAGTGPLQLVVIAADKGLCGGFNANIIRRAIQIYREANAAQRPIRLSLVGRKPRDFFQRLQVPTAGEYVNFFNRLSFADADVISEDLMRSYLKGEVDEVVLLYTQFRSVVSLKVTEQRLLPFGNLAGGQDKASKTSSEYAFEPDAQEILKAMLPRAVKTQVWRALLESSASEFAAKMTAMDNATRNSKEMIGSLTLYANRIRQAMITKEIAEIVGGAEALK